MTGEEVLSEHEAIREALLELEAPSEAIATHLEGCAECRAFAEALKAVDAQLAELPALTVSDALLARTMERIEREQEAPRELGVAAMLIGLLGALAGGLVALVKLAISPFLHPKTRRWSLGIGIAVPAVAALGAVFLVTERGADVALQEARPAPATPEEAQRIESHERAPAFETLHDEENGELRGETWWDDGDEGLAQPIDALAQADEATGEGDARDGWLPMGAPASPAVSQPEAANRVALAEDAPAQRADEALRAPAAADTTVELPPADLAPAEQPIEGGRLTGDLGGAQAVVDGRFRNEEAPAREAEHRDSDGVEDALMDEAEARARTLEPGDDLDREEANAPADRQQRAATRGAVTRTSTLEQRDEAARFLASRDQVDGVPFVAARGYWASTYVPGDPALRLLRGRLASSPDALALAERAQPADLALDPPSRGALALSVSADRAAVEGRSRVLVSVGLRGAAARAGRRPTLRAQIVIDARQPLDADAQARARALLMALSRSRQGADRIGVIVAGPHGGELLPLGELRYGELTLALRRLFGEAPSDAAPMSLEDAMRLATSAVGQLEDASSPLASALVLVVTPGLTDDDARTLAPLAHAGGLAGVTTTALALRDGAALDPLEQIALAGQGRRRVLASIDGAEQLVRSEVEAVSQVVARAVRVRIRLAPGVSLVGVIGSRRLDGAETRRVREAERAVDRRLARQLGIASDRGADDDGIQIVLPAFYADDAHAVLLDVVVPGPGPVADVSVQLKDLVRLENATASARLTLARGARERGPRERSVLGQLVAHELATALRDAARSLDAGDAEAARARIERARALIVGTRGVAESTASDLELCAAYEAAIQNGMDRGALASSLRYASRRRIEGDPLAIDGR